MASEAEVRRAEGPVLLEEVAEVRGNARVETNMEARGAAEVVAEEPEARMELLKDDGLRLDLAHLLGDDAFGHLLDDEQALLDDLDGLGVADELGVLLNDGLAADVADEVVGAVEVVEAAEGGNALEVIKGEATTNSKGLGDGLSGHTGNEGSRDEGEFAKFSEHLEC